MDAFRVLVELRPASPPADRYALRAIHQQAFSDKPEAIGFAKRDTWIVLEADIKSTFSKWRQKTAWQNRRDNDRCHNPARDARENQWPAIDGPKQKGPIGMFEVPQQKTITFPATTAREKIVGKHGRH